MPTSTVSLHPRRVGHFATGLWTNKFVLRDNADDTMADGLNLELSSRLSGWRRPGHSVYNSATFPPIQRFYEFRSLDPTTETIRLIADTAATVYDATGPSTQTALWAKSAGAGETTFLGVGNSLYFTNGTDSKKWLQAANPWLAGKAYALGNYVIVAGQVQQVTTAGTSGVTAPSFAATWGATTTESTGLVWTNRGSAVADWQPSAPRAAPTITQTAVAQTYPSWTTHNYYSTCYLITDSNGAIQKVTAFGTTGSTQPAWTTTTTIDGSVTWTYQGTGARGPISPVAAGAYLQTNDALGVSYYFQATAGGRTAATAPIFPAQLGATVVDGSVTWTNVGVAQTWGSVTSSSLLGGYAALPVMGGGYVLLGAGAGTQGAMLKLPSGFGWQNSLVWTSVGEGLGGAQLGGVLQSGGTGGTLNSVWATRGGASAFTPATQWVAAVWSATAAVTQTTSSGITYLQFTTAAGQTISIAQGKLASGSALSVPSGFTASDAIAIAGLATTASTGIGMQAMLCSFDASLNLTAYYRDGSLNQEQGTSNVFAVFAQGGAFSSITGGTALTLPTMAGGEISLFQFAVNNGAAFGIPAGFNVYSVALSPRDQVDAAGSAVSHGLAALHTTGTTVNAAMGDGSGDLWGISVNGFGVGVLQAQTAINPAQTIVDTNGGLEQIAISGVSGATAPLWQSTQSALTVDNSAQWLLNGVTQIGWTAPGTYVYDYQNALDSSTSNASPASSAITLQVGYNGYVTGVYSADPQVHTVRIFRTVQGGTTYFLLASIPNVLGTGTWNYTDASVDAALNILIRASVALALSPPPAGAVAPAYHLQRVFVAIGNTVQYSVGPDAILYAANGATGFPPANIFVYPSRVVRMWPNALGLIVLTSSDLYIILGSGTATDPLYTVPFLEGVGLLSYDGFAVNKSTAYMLAADGTLLSLDPGAGVVDMGLPIADKISAYTSLAGLTWHAQSSTDTALYAWDGAVGWYRLSANVAPEQGHAWSPQAQIQGGCVAAYSFDIAPGKKRLLVSSSAPGPILMRDTTTRADNGIPYPESVTFGSITLASPSELSLLHYVTIESAHVGTKPSPSVLLGEIAGTYQPLLRTRQDPPLLPPSKSIYADRYHFGQSQMPVACRHVMLRLDWPAENVATELFTFTLVEEQRVE